MRAFAIVFLLSLSATLTLACEEIPPVVDKGGDNNQGTADVATGAGTTGASSGSGTGGAGGAGSSSSAASSGSGDAGTSG